MRAAILLLAILTGCHSTAPWHVEWVGPRPPNAGAVVSRMVDVAEEEGLGGVDLRAVWVTAGDIPLPGVGGYTVWRTQQRDAWVLLSVKHPRWAETWRHELRHVREGHFH